MRIKLFLAAGVALLIAGIGCTPRTAPVADSTPMQRARLVEPIASHFHRPISLQVGWRNYRESEVVRDADGGLVMLPPDSLDGEVPAILVGDPMAEDGVWIGMDIDDALLGRLIKTSLMTQVPIAQPFENYLENATCSPCHPSDKVQLHEWWQN